MQWASFFGFRHFPDPVLERRYRHEQRIAQAGYTLWAIVLALGGLLLYWAANFVRLDFTSALAITRDQALFLPLLAGFAWALRRPLYADAWWLDILLFAAVLPPLMVSLASLLASGATGWTYPGLATYGMQTTLACACLAFAAAVRSFAFLAAGSVVFLAMVLHRYGYAPGVIGYTLSNYAFFAIIVFFLNVVIDRKARATFVARINLASEREKSEELLANMLPAPVAERLKQHQAVADSYDDIVVVFVDMVGFTPLSQQLGPVRIVELLNAFFERADHGTDLFQLEKVKTIGDAYMAVAGAMTHPPRPAKAAIDFAVWLRREARAVGRRFEVDLRLHVGIASGPAIGGVIAAKKLTYDYWGHTVNFAARLQDSVGADEIGVSEAVRQAVGESYPFAGPRLVGLKGMGEVAMYEAAPEPGRSGAS